MASPHERTKLNAVRLNVCRSNQLAILLPAVVSSILLTARVRQRIITSQLQSLMLQVLYVSKSVSYLRAKRRDSDADVFVGRSGCCDYPTFNAYSFCL